jgi:hypothetical protein
MAKAAPDAFMDAAFDWLDQSTRMYACSGEPANYAGIAAVTLATATMTADTDYTKANGASGRKVTVAAKTGVSITASGTATHIVLASLGDSTLRYVTTCTSQALVSGGTVDFPAWDIQISDPT